MAKYEGYVAEENAGVYPQAYGFVGIHAGQGSSELWPKNRMKFLGCRGATALVAQNSSRGAIMQGLSACPVGRGLVKNVWVKSKSGRTKRLATACGVRLDWPCTAMVKQLKSRKCGKIALLFLMAHDNHGPPAATYKGGG